MKKLRNLDLSNNSLKTLPASIGELRDTLLVLDLRGNPLLEHGNEDGVTLGWRQLKDIFDDRVIIDQDILEPSNIEIVPKEQVYEEMEKNRVHWNMEVVRGMRPVPVEKHTLSIDEMCRMWRDIEGYVEAQGGLWEPEEKKAKTKAETIEKAKEYIRNVYDRYNKLVEMKEKQGSQLSNVEEDSLVGAGEKMDVLEALFVKISEMREDRSKTVDDIKATVAVMVDVMTSIGLCFVGQIGGLRDALNLAYRQDVREASSFESLIRNKVCNLKDMCFRLAMTPGGGNQNVHVEAYWRYMLRDEVGFDVRQLLQHDMEMYGNDIYKGSVGNALQGLFEKFTPEYVCREVKVMINKDKDLVGRASTFLTDRWSKQRTDVDGNVSSELMEYLSSRFKFEDDVDMVPIKINARGAEDLLVAMNILLRKSTQSENPSAASGWSMLYWIEKIGDGIHWVLHNLL